MSILESCSALVGTKMQTIGGCLLAVALSFPPADCWAPVPTVDDEIYQASPADGAESIRVNFQNVTCQSPFAQLNPAKA